ncbi:hypothetical protein DM02DRAFT_731933 [Periconia macrospinosa]|uniref:C2H2-type domain-containing protein n=1 Tax=Periconia macrospinosa TaxID=97972 RepID=A0A2V1DB73_9PLEO|nr:hypothetical protein DM02DRAFT_731933 [Periconia macrospinosa]
MSEYVNHDMQLAALDTPIDDTDWTALKKEVMSEPWIDWIDWSACEEHESTEQGPEGLIPENRRIGLFESPIQGMTSSQPTSAPPTTQTRSYQCDFTGCKSKRSFKRVSELNRHKKIHDRKLFPCPAVECGRIGDRAFPREDKLRDHIVAGHDAEDRFLCLIPRCACGLSFTKDIMGVHHDGLSSPFSTLRYHRSCPFEKCPERFTLNRLSHFPRYHLVESKYSRIRTHISQEHTLESRTKFATLIHAHGYHHSTLEVLCPVCPNQSVFQNVLDFYYHFLEIHCHVGDARVIADALQIYQQYSREWFREHNLYKLLRQCTDFSDEIHQNRRTILRLWPEFIEHPVWDDIKSWKLKRSGLRKEE